MNHLLNAETLRLEQADHVLAAIERCLRAGHSVTFEPTKGGTIVTVTPMGSRVGIAIARPHCRDAAGHCLQIALGDLAEAERERAALRERLADDSEPRFSLERDGRVST